MKFLIGNLKMNLIFPKERENYWEGFNNCLLGRNFKNVAIVLCPPFVHAESFKQKIKSEFVFFGSQNIHFEEKGRFTGEVSAPMVKNFCGDFVIIGHSERRRFFGEDDEVINKKIKSALKNELVPIFCIGETAAERSSGEIKRVISDQLSAGLKGINLEKLKDLIIAYEPIWSIGSGRFPKTDEVMEVRILIQKILRDSLGLEIDELPKIIYGGSVDSRNIKSLCLDSGMDGVLVGGESLHPIDFIKIGEVLENN
ncbi:MAG: triose-phosphate isomerase [Candidatus Moraniibacteriota bacterium]